MLDLIKNQILLWPRKTELASYNSNSEPLLSYYPIQKEWIEDNLEVKLNIARLSNQSSL